MKSTIERQENGTIKLIIPIPQEEVKKTKEEVIEEAVKGAELPGFRKGKAPRKMVEERMDETKTREEVLRKLLPQMYIKAVTEHNLKPIINPKIHVEKVEDNADWQFSALIAEAPEVKLNNYKDKIKSITAKSKIAIPGKKEEEVKFDDIVKELLDTTEVEIPGLLVEQEVERLLSHLLDDIKKLGLSLDQYLATTSRTPENLREEYEKRAKDDLKLELVLQKIGEVENISVSDKELDEAILKAKSPQEKEQLESNRYLLAGILRQQKTLDFLRNL